MTETNGTGSNRAGLGMVIFIVAMVTLAAVGQLFIKHGVNNFESVITLEEHLGEIFIPESSLVKDAVDTVVGFDDDGEKTQITFNNLGKYKEGIHTDTFSAGEKIIIKGKFPSDFMGFLTMVFYWPIFIGLCIYFFFGFAWLKILGSVPVSFAFPFLALGYIVIILGSAIFLGEIINTLRILAILLIIGGVICLSRSDTTEQVKSGS